MKRSLSVIIVLFHIITLKAQTAIIIQRGANTFLETRLDSALLHTQTGDVVYLPGGYILGSDNITVNKKIMLIGAGYHSDSSSATTPTRFKGQLTLDTGAAGSLVTGIYMPIFSTIVRCSNLTISRCNFGSLSLPSNNSSGNILIEENVIRSGISGGSYLYTNILFSKNIIYGNITGPVASGGITFTNNIFTGLFSSGTIFNSLFQNNIFLGNAPLFTNSYNQFVKNLFVASPLTFPDSTSYGNVFNEPLSSIFINYNGPGSWDHLQNFHLKPGCRGIGLGTDGYDAGIYGTAIPFKEGGIPFNPHFRAINIPAYVNPDGKLHININVKAQDH